MKYTNAASITLWVPGYFCNSALISSRRLPVNIKFYRNCASLSPDWDALENAVKGESNPQILILVHYFGFPNATTEAKRFCESHGIILFEDSAHVLCPNPHVGKADIQLFSPHKMLALPDGAILVASQDVINLTRGTQCGSRKRDNLNWITKRMIQKGLKKIHFPWHLVRSLDREIAPAGVGGGLQYNSYSLRLLTRLERKLEQVITQRRQNYARILSWLTRVSSPRIFVPSLVEGVCPYALPLKVESGCASVVERLRSRGIPASTWPDLPPEVITSPRIHADAISTFNKLMLIPIHQSLSVREVDQIGGALNEVFKSISS